MECADPNIVVKAALHTSTSMSSSRRHLVTDHVDLERASRLEVERDDLEPVGLESRDDRAPDATLTGRARHERLE